MFSEKLLKLEWSIRVGNTYIAMFLISIIKILKYN